MAKTKKEEYPTAGVLDREIPKNIQLSNALPPQNNTNFSQPLQNIPQIKPATQTNTTNPNPNFKGSVVVHGSELQGNATYDYTAPDGKVYKGLTQQQWNATQGQSGQKAIADETSREIKSTNERAFLQRQQQEKGLMNTPINQNNLTPEQIASLGNIPQQVGVDQASLNRGDIGKIVGSTLKFGGMGAGAGSLVGSAVPVVGTAIGAGAGAVIGGAYGLIDSLFSSLESERASASSGQYSNFNFAKSQTKKIQTMVNKGMISQDQAIDAYNQNLATIQLAESTIKAQVDKLTGEKKIQAQTDLTNIKMYLDQEPLIRQGFTIALMNPNPNAIDNLDLLTQ